MRDSDNEVEGKCIIFSAPSGAGKTTIVKHLLKQNFNLAFSVSACSRAQREGEVHKKDYYFLTVDQFKERIKRGDFLEWEEVYTDNFYGTLRSEIERIWNEEKHVIFDVDVVGGANLKRIFGNRALAIFVMPPSISLLEDRLRSRDTENEESIARRMAKAEAEIGYAEQFDVILMNDDLQKALIEAEDHVSRFLGIQNASV